MASSPLESFLYLRTFSKAGTSENPSWKWGRCDTPLGHSNFTRLEVIFQLHVFRTWPVTHILIWRTFNRRVDWDSNILQFLLSLSLSLNSQPKTKHICGLPTLSNVATLPVDAGHMSIQPNHRCDHSWLLGKMISDISTDGNRMYESYIKLLPKSCLSVFGWNWTQKSLIPCHEVPCSAENPSSYRWLLSYD